jgi:hypothetical protein
MMSPGAAPAGKIFLAGCGRPGQSRCRVALWPVKSMPCALGSPALDWRCIIWGVSVSSHFFWDLRRFDLHGPRVRSAQFALNHSRMSQWLNRYVATSAYPLSFR